MGVGPSALFFLQSYCTKMQYSLFFAMKRLQTHRESLRTAAAVTFKVTVNRHGLAAACGPARTRHSSAASTSPDESRAIRRFCRIRGHPLAARDHGNSFLGSEAKHSATAWRNPPIF